MPLHWEPIESLSRDDANWRRQIAEGSDEADPDIVILSFEAAEVHCHSTAVFQTQPQIACRPTHLYVPARIAEKFSIRDFRVGAHSQFVTPAPIPASWFAVGRGSPIACKDDVTPGLFVSLRVSNETLTNARFEGLLRCKRPTGLELPLPPSRSPRGLAGGSPWSFDGSKWRTSVLR